MSFNHLILRADHWQQIVVYLKNCLPEEACGLVGGKNGRSELVILVPNQLHSPVRFRMDPVEQWNAFKTLEERKLDLLAIFHSHPQGPQVPSATDQAEFAYPGVYSLICTPIRDNWQGRVFIIGENAIYEAQLLIE